MANHLSPIIAGIQWRGLAMALALAGAMVLSGCTIYGTPDPQPEVSQSMRVSPEYRHPIGTLRLVADPCPVWLYSPSLDQEIQVQASLPILAFESDHSVGSFGATFPGTLLFMAICEYAVAVHHAPDFINGNNVPPGIVLTGYDADLARRGRPWILATRPEIEIDLDQLGVRLKPRDLPATQSSTQPSTQPSTQDAKFSHVSTEYGILTIKALHLHESSADGPFPTHPLPGRVWVKTSQRAKAFLEMVQTDAISLATQPSTQPVDYHWEPFTAESFGRFYEKLNAEYGLELAIVVPEPTTMPSTQPVTAPSTQPGQ